MPVVRDATLEPVIILSSTSNNGKTFRGELLSLTAHTAPTRPAVFHLPRVVRFVGATVGEPVAPTEAESLVTAAALILASRPAS